MNFNKYGRTAQLFDYQTMSDGLVGGTLNSDGTITTNAASSSWTITKYIPVTGREFTLQRQASGGATSICLYDSNQTYITGLAYNGNGTVTVSANTDVSYIRFTYYRTENTGNIMLNEGSTAKPFEPYGNTWHDIPHYIMGTSTDTITTLPADVYADGNNATVGISGNMEQSGTPTPSNPIQPSETGERTENLFDKNSNTTNNNGYIRPGVEVPAGTYSIDNGTPHHVYYRIGYSGIAQQTNPGMKTEGIVASDSLYVWRDADIREDGVMLNTGSTAIPYEPYGYKIPILSANTTTPVYLGEVESTRQIKQLVLTGQEEFVAVGDGNIFRLSFEGYLRNSNNIIVCTHYVGEAPVEGYAQLHNLCVAFLLSSSGSNFLYIRDDNYTSASTFKTYLQQQYAAGTPVTVWYILATPTTGIVNEPIRKIGDYADEVSGITIPTIAGADSFDVLTTLKPSEVTVNYKGWHTGADVHERENGAWT